MLPSSPGNNPPMIFRRVDFPQPDGPIRATNSPLFISKLIPFKTSTLVLNVSEPNPFFKSLTSNNCTIFHQYSSIKNIFMLCVAAITLLTIFN